MNTKQELLEKLKQNLGVEILARDTYTKFLQQIKDADLIKTISQIRDEEINHIGIVNSLVGLVSEYEQAVSIKEPKKKKEDIFKNCNAILMVAGIEIYMHHVLNILKNIADKTRIIYVSYNKIPKYIKSILQEHQISPSKVFFINCISADIKNGVNISPEDLTTISIAIKEATARLKDCIVVVDMLPSFTTYHDIKVIGRFVASINDDARKNSYYILWVSTNEPSENALNAKMAELCDKTIRLT